MNLIFLRTSFFRNKSLFVINLNFRSGQRTVPNVFIQGNHIGGNDDTHKLHAEVKIYIAGKKFYFDLGN